MTKEEETLLTQLDTKMDLALDRLAYHGKTLDILAANVAVSGTRHDQSEKDRTRLWGVVLLLLAAVIGLALKTIAGG